MEWNKSKIPTKVLAILTTWMMINLCMTMMEINLKKKMSKVKALMKMKVATMMSGLRLVTTFQMTVQIRNLSIQLTNS